MSETFNEELEKFVISCLLKDGSKYAEVRDILVNESFAWPPLGTIYEAIMSASDKDLYPDMVTVVNELGSRLDTITLMSLENKRGRDVLEHLRELDVDPDRIEDYAYQVQSLHAGRRIVSMATSAIDLIESGTSPSDVLSGMDLQSGHIAINIGSKTGAIKTGADVSAKNLNDLERVLRGELNFVPTGLKAWDKFMNGLTPGRLYVVSAFSADGKSALGTNLLNNIAINAEKREKVLLLSLEMSAEETNNRLAQARCGVPPLRIESGQLTEEEVIAYTSALEEISNAGTIFYDDSANMILPLLRTKIRKAAGLGVMVVIIDQLEQVLIGLNGNAGKSDSALLNFIAYRIKEYAREFGVAIVLMHQMNRSNDNVDARRSGAAVYDVNMTGLSQAGEKPADAVLMIRHQRDENNQITNSYFVWAKNRHGATGVAEVAFVGRNLLFRDLDNANANHPAWSQELIDNYKAQEELEEGAIQNESGMPLEDIDGHGI